MDAIVPHGCWVNPCGHIDKYDKVRAEAAGLELEMAAIERAGESNE
jgi:hypothetical protein